MQRAALAAIAYQVRGVFEAMARRGELRSMVKVARTYHEQGLTQAEILQRLGIHQPAVSRLLQRARRKGIIRLVISAPAGIHEEMEAAPEARFGLQGALVADTGGSGEQIVRNLGAAARARYDGSADGVEEAFSPPPFPLE